MKKAILSLLMLCCAIVMMAQPQSASGGFKMPETNPQYKDLNYAGDSLEAHRLDIYLPATGHEKYKVVMVIYGSAWFANNMKAMGYLSIGKPLVDAGFAVVSINHRSSGDAKFPAQINDVKAAIRYIRAHAEDYHLDTSFIGITGYSSGGHLSSLAGVTNHMKTHTVGKTTVDIEGNVGHYTDYSSEVDAVVDWFGPVDMATMERCETVKDAKSPEAALIGGAPADMPDMISLTSPYSYVTPNIPRFLVIHGNSDSVVPYCQSERFAAALKKKGRLEKFITVEGGEHGPVTFNENTFNEMVTFFQQEAKAKQTLANQEGQPSLWNIRGQHYPKVLADHRVVFRVKAPTAKHVQIDFGRKYDMYKDRDGIWTCVTDPQSEGFHYYFLVIDGVRVADPQSESFYGCSMMTSGVEIPYDDIKAPRFAQRDVARGDVHRKRYFSKVDNKWKTMYIYTPAAYDTNPKATFPVLYLQHGGGEDERGWSNQGLTDIILDNLIADGKAVPMVVVMMDGNTSDFTAEWTQEGIPFVEKNFRVKKGMKYRALAGLSMGGIHTLNALVSSPDLVSYAGVFSSGWFKERVPWASFIDTEACYKTLKEKVAIYNKNLKKLWLSMGGEEDIAYENCKAMRARFDEMGLKYDYYEYPGGHTWPVWRESIYQFAQLIFK